MDKYYYYKINQFREAGDLKSCVSFLEGFDKQGEKIDYGVLAKVYMMLKDFDKAKSALKKYYKGTNENVYATLTRGYVSNNRHDDVMNVLNQVVYRNVFLEPHLAAEKILVLLKEKWPSIYEDVLKKTRLTHDELVVCFHPTSAGLYFDYILCKVFNGEEIKSTINFKELYGGKKKAIIESLFDVTLGPYNSEKNDELYDNYYLQFRYAFEHCSSEVYALCVASVIEEINLDE